MSATATVRIERCAVLDTWPTTCAHGLAPAAEGAAAEVLLRRARLGAVRPDHLAARVLPHALRARDPQPPRAGDRGEQRRRGAGRARLGHGLQDARAAVRDGRRRARCAATCRSTWTSRWSQACAVELVELYPGSRCTAWSATSSRDLEHIPAGDAPAVRLPRRHDRQPLPARAHALPAPAAPRDGARRPAADRHGPGQGPRDARGRLQRQRGRDRRVQPQRAARDQRGLDADFDPDAFEHVAFFDEANSWIEMRLRANGAQTVRIAGANLEVRFADGEEIRTEISAKFTPRAVERRADAGGPPARATSTPTTAACSGSPSPRRGA